MEEVEATILDGDTEVVPDVAISLDSLAVADSPPDYSGWHAHVLMPLSYVLAPGKELRVRLADGRSGPVMVSGPPVIEGGQALYVLDGIGPLSEPTA